MIIINTGVPKSATTLLFDYQKDIINCISKSNALNELKNQNNGMFIQILDEKRYQMIVNIHKDFGDIVFKTHQPPDNYLKMLVEKHGAKVTCCYRDPRDIVLSALDHGIKTRDGKDKSGAFKTLFSTKDVVCELKHWLKIYFEWINYGNVLMVKYEEFIPRKYSFLVELKKYLNITISDDVLYKIYINQEKETKSKFNFNKGLCNRWQEEMSVKDIDYCNFILGKEIQKMGYSI